MTRTRSRLMSPARGPAGRGSARARHEASLAFLAIAATFLTSAAVIARAPAAALGDDGVDSTPSISESPTGYESAASDWDPHSSAPSLPASDPPAEPSPTPTEAPAAASAAPPAVPSPAVPEPAVALPAPYPGHCQDWRGAKDRANLLLSNHWQIGVHPPVALPVDRSWTENPFHDRNWQFVDHSLRVLHSAFEVYAETGDLRYRERASAILQDWVRDNPQSAPRSVWSWNDHSTALRAIVLACSTLYLTRDPWLESALETHGRTLADPGFYRHVSNHALNQDIGLLEVANVLGRSDWQTLALSRLGKLAARSIDSEGVTNEQSVFYQYYNYERYSLALSRIEAMGLTPPPSFDRIGLMPNFLGYATLPNGEYEMIGDTDRRAGWMIPGSQAEFAASKGASGTKPRSTVAAYRAGWLFARSGWGERRPYADEVAVSLRFGPRPTIHGHADAGSITLYGHGARLLIDPGKFTYNRDRYRSWFTGRSAHNVVTVDGIGWNTSLDNPLINHSTSSTMATARVRLVGNSGVAHIRGITFSRNLDYLLVDDRISSKTRRTFRQLWHLTPDSRPHVEPGWFLTQRDRGNVVVRQLLNGSSSRVVVGQVDPIQGWLSWEHGVRLEAPVIEVVRHGTTVRYLTLIVAAAGKPASSVSELTLTKTGYSLVVSIGARSERVVVDGSRVTITPLD